MKSTTPAKIDKQAKVFQFGDADVRWTPDGRAVAIDVLAALGQIDPIRAWRNAKKAHAEFVEESSTYSFGGRGRPPEVLTEKGVLKLAMVAGGPRAAEFREWAANVLKAFMDADARIAESIIDRQDDPATLMRIAERARSKVTGSALEDEIKAGKGVHMTYAVVHDRNNKLVTGASSAQLRERLGTDKIRDRYALDSLVKLNAAQQLEANHMHNTQPRGHNEILHKQEEVINDLRPVFEKYQLTGGTRIDPALPPAVASTTIEPRPASRVPARRLSQPADLDRVRGLRRELESMEDGRQPDLFESRKPAGPPQDRPWAKHLVEK